MRVTSLKPAYTQLAPLSPMYIGKCAQKQKNIWSFPPLSNEGLVPLSICREMLHFDPSPPIEGIYIELL